MRRPALLLPLIALGVGATALAQDSPPRSVQEPDVRPRAVFDMPSACRPGERVRVRIDPPAGVVLASVRIHVAGIETVRLTDVDSPATVTVLIDGKETRVSASADTAGGQRAVHDPRLRPLPGLPPADRPADRRRRRGLALTLRAAASRRSPAAARPACGRS